jgi:hypothetical protein
MNERVERQTSLSEEHSKPDKMLAAKKTWSPPRLEVSDVVEQTETKFPIPIENAPPGFGPSS